MVLDITNCTNRLILIIRSHLFVSNKIGLSLPTFFALRAKSTFRRARTKTKQTNPTTATVLCRNILFNGVIVVILKSAPDRQTL